MTGSSLDRVRDLFWAALDRPEDDREAYLAAACGDDRDLFQEVSALLAADRREGLIEEPPPTEPCGSAAEDPEGSLLPAAGRRVGAYRLERVLGRGGMGVVFEATRADGQYTKTVAVKLVDQRSVGSEARARFLFERQVLAQLEHPHIAALLDGGVTDREVPYLVMELVRGRPITEHCDRERLSVRRRIDLFLTVCDAVQHAHQASVLHRDLKPSNILVTEGGEPKLLDFGVAKLLDPSALGGAPDPPATVAWAMTPSYASPEQLRGERRLTTASDVYSLAVLLYELLTGSLPYLARADDPVGLRQAILEGRIARPSRSSPTAEVAAGRGVEPAALSRALTGDLERIVLAALRLDPAERYPTVEALAADLRRFLGGFPIEAREPTFLYRGRKFLRRHALGVAAIVAVVLTLAAAAVVSALQARRAEEERDRAEATKKLLVEAFDLADPWQARGDTVTAREVLDRGAQRVDRELAGQPRLRADLLSTLGGIYRNLGLYERALALDDEALAIRRKLSHGAGPEVAASLEASALALRELGRFAEAERRLREALALREELADRFDPAAISDRMDLGEALRAAGRLGEAETLLRAALADARRATRDRASAVADGAGILGALLYSRDRFADAEALFREALRMRLATLPEDHPLIAQAWHNLGEVLRSQAEYPEAERCLRRALAIRRRVFGDRHPAVANTWNGLGIAQFQEGHLEAAAVDLDRALAIYRQVYPPDHPTIATALGNLATIEFRLGRVSDAERDFRGVLAVQERALGPSHPGTARALHNLAAAVRDAGRPAESLPLFRRALAIRRRALGPRSPAVASTLDSYATALLRLDRPAEAEPLYREALTLRRKTLGNDHPDTARSELHLGILLTGAGRPALAEPLLRQAASTFAKVVGGEHRDTAVARTYLAACLLRLDRAGEAEHLLEESRPVMETKVPAESPDHRAFEIALRRLSRTHRTAPGPAGR